MLLPTQQIEEREGMKEWRPAVSENMHSARVPLKPGTEAELVQRCQRHDEGATRLLYLSHAKKIYSLALRFTANEADAEDVVQETFIRVFRNIDRFDGRSSFGTWAFRIAVNLCRDRSRRSRVASRKIVELDDNTHSGMEFPDRRREDDILARKHLIAALSLLPEGYREVLVLHDVFGNAHTEIASILEVAVGTSKSQLHKARARLREILQDLSL